MNDRREQFDDLFKGVQTSTTPTFDSRMVPQQQRQQQQQLQQQVKAQHQQFSMENFIKANCNFEADCQPISQALPNNFLDHEPLKTFRKTESSAVVVQQSPRFAEKATTETKNPPPTIGRSRIQKMNQNQRFLVFVKVIFKILEKQGDATTLIRAKTIVAECTKRNRAGDRSFMPLEHAIRTRLRRTVGELYWSRARECFVGA